ncbi:hypothetical protein OSB04_012403, partial [Centaurea solstitialis]
MFKYQEWHKHNRIALIYIKKCMTDVVKGRIPESDLAKYKVSDKAETRYLMNKLIGMSFNRQGSIREYILQGIDPSCKLKEMKVENDDSFLVHIHYLINIEESEIKNKGKAIAINYMSKFKNKTKKPSNFHKGSSSTSFAKKIKNKGKSFKNKRELKSFCKKTRHFKKDCEGFKEWLNKKGSPIHIVNSMQGLSKITVPKLNESRICTTNGQVLKVE